MKLLLALILLAISSHVFAAKILSFSPSGNNIQYKRQINISFSKKMVPLGKTQVSNKLPIKILPKVDCSWRWVDPQNLTCELKDDLPLATSYTVRVDKNLKDIHGNKLDKDYRHKFETVRPKVSYVHTRSYRSWTHPLKPIIDINLNIKVKKQDLYKFISVQKGKVFELIPREGYGCKKDVCSQWTTFIEGKFKRGADYKLKIKKGIKAALGGPLSSTFNFNHEFKTVPEFKIKKYTCYYQKKDKSYQQEKKYLFSLYQKSDFSKNKVCEPHLNKYIEFTTPVLPETSYPQISMLVDKKSVDSKKYFIDTNDYSSKYPSFTLNLPKVLNSKSNFYFDLSNIKNIYGETLKGRSNLTVAFVPRSPSIKIVNKNAIIESQINNDIPLLVTNMQSYNLEYDIWTYQGVKRGLKKVKKIPLIHDVTYKTPLGINDLLGNLSGSLFYDIPETKKGYDKRKSYAQATPFQILYKIGHFNGKVWVLDLKTGKPIKNATIRLVRFGEEDSLFKAVKTNSEGIATTPGLRSFSGNLSIFKSYYKENGIYYLTATKDKDFAALPIHYDYYANYWSSPVYPQMKEKFGHIKVWGLTPQGIYKAGSDIDFKVYVRSESNEKISMPSKELTYSIEIIDPLGKKYKTYSDIKLNEFGTYHNKLLTSKSMVNGEYSVYLNADYEYYFNKRLAFKFIVTDFKPAAFKVQTAFDKTQYKKNENIQLETLGTYFSGGGYAGNQATLNLKLVSKVFKPKSSKFSKFDFYYKGYHAWSKAIYQNSKLLDKDGKLLSSYLIKSDIPYGTLYAESSVRDERGKDISNMSTAQYFGSSVYLGGKIEKWSYEVGDDVEINHIVLDQNEKIAKNKIVKVKILKEMITAAKVKSSGNAYVTKYQRDWKEVDSCLVKIKDDENICEYEPKDPGYYRVVSTVKGQKHPWQGSFYVIGSGQFLWGADDNDQIDLVSENTSLKVGDKAKILIKNPFKKAKALITVERYGILDSWIEEIDESAKIIEIKVKPDYLPGFYVSVNLFSHRVEKSKGFGKLDLGKPSLKSGYIAFEVRDKYKEIEFEIETDKKEYLPGDEVEIEIEADARNGSLGKSELAIAVLDEAVFDLLKNGDDYFDPYKGLFKLDGLDVRTLSLIKNLLGRQKFEKKGANQGGGGGQAPKVRSLINYLAYWNPHIKLDDGEGKVKFKLPDNLTSWKVLAIVTGKNDRLGLGTYKFKTNQPTQIRAALPNQVNEGDEFKARFTIVNRENSKRDLKIKINANGQVKSKISSSLDKKITLKANEKKTIELPINVTNIKATKRGEKGVIRFLVEAGDRLHTDKLIKYLIVNKKRPSSFAAIYGDLFEKDTQTIPIKFPKNIYADRGGIDLSFSGTIINNIIDGFKYLKNYPYACWEQKLSKALAAVQYLKLKKYTKGSLEWSDAQALVSKTLSKSSEYQLPEGGMGYYGKYSDAYLSAYTLLAFSWLESYGFTPPKEVKENLLNYNKQLLRENFFKKYWNRSMRSSTRAVILHALSLHGELDKSDIERFKKEVGSMSQFGFLHYVQASMQAKHKDSKKLMADLIGKLTVDAGRVFLDQKYSNQGRYYLESFKRTQCMGLSTFLTAVDNKISLEKISSIPQKLVRTVTKEMMRKMNFWNSTQDTLYCLNGLIQYSTLYEKTEPSLSINVIFKDQEIGSRKIKGVSSKVKNLSYNLNTKDRGVKSNLKLTSDGKGRGYFKALLSYSSKDKQKSQNNGIKLKKYFSIKKKGKWEKLKGKIKLKRGDTLRVDLFLTIPTKRYFVVIDDPISGGFEPLNDFLATESQIDSAGGDSEYQEISKLYRYRHAMYFGNGPQTFYHKEIKFDKALFYSTSLNSGSYHVSYKIQAIATGSFQLLPAQAKEMYDEEVNGSTEEREVLIED